VFLGLTGPVTTQVLIANAGYLASVLMFMFGIMRMGKVKTARSGNQLAAGAMLLAIISQFVEMGQINPWWIVAGIVIGSTVGLVAAIKVEMTEMPEMVALFNGSGGIASALVALAAYLYAGIPNIPLMNAAVGGVSTGSVVNGLAIVLSILIGCVTFTGSIIAFGKLSGKVSGAPILLPGRHVINAALLLMSLGGAVLVVFTTGGPPGLGIIIAVTIVALILGVMLVIPIGGGDMPVVISLLNSYSGLAAAMAGFAINSPVLIVSGSLVGAAGLILTQIMCKAMNRSLANVLFGGFGGADSSGGGGGADEYTNVKAAEGEEVAMILEDVESLIFVPGYGMAVSQAQHLVRELGDLMEERGCKVSYAIHPVAGRMPGHMNVLLAEANVPYEQLFELDQINNDFKNTDAVIVIGANDVVNPDAVDKKDSPLYGMPVLNVWEARTCFVIKRSLSPGFAAVKNPLFEADNTYMVFGDGRKAIEDIINNLKGS
jgi:H+-translocating NAD(P) transhydrogenase subunit beta